MKMKSTLFILALALTTQLGFSQNFAVLLGENFDAATAPAGWTQTMDQTFPAGISSTTPSTGWAFGQGTYTSIYWDVPASVDGTPFAISNDDVVDQNKLEDVLISPTMDFTPFDSVLVIYDVFYDSLYQLSQGYMTISYDAGANWLYLPLAATTLNDGWVEDGWWLPSSLTVNTTTYTFSDQMQIGFLHTDGGGWSTGVAIDNVIVGGFNNPCDDVIAIPSCGSPQNVTLSGPGTIDWEFTTGCGYTTEGQEQLYTFTPTVTGVHTLNVISATGNSWIDYMYKPVSAGCDTLGWTCMGDANAPEAYGMNLTAGVQYYILADNEFEVGESQTFSISCPCTFTSQGFTPESEACGADLNGGCNSTPEAYEPIACGASVSGTLWADGGTRDTDWYELVVTENTDVEVDFASGMPVNVLLADNCTDLNTLAEATSAACGSGSFTFAVTPGTYLLVVVPTAFEAYPCGTANGGNDYDLTVTYCENTQPITPCLTSDFTYTDLNTAGGAPCNDGNGCTPTDPGFSGIGIFGSETYLLNNVQAGFDYVFNMCSGFGAGSWIPEIAIVAADGTTVDAWNGEAATGSSLTFIDQCSLEWTATQSGTYFIIINQLGTAAGDAPNQVDCETTYAVDNGNPVVMCGTNAATCFPCEAGTLTSPAEQNVCPGQTFEVALSGNSTPSTYDLFFDNSNTNGTGGIEAPVTITGYTQTDFPLAIDEDINGTLSTNNLPPLAGTWEVRVRVVDGAGEDCDSTGVFTVNFLPANDPICLTVGIEETETLSAKVYPNPSNGEFTVEMDNVEGNVEFRVYDMAGRTVLTTVHAANGTLREQINLPTGSFVLQLISDKAVLTERLVVE